MRQKTIIEVMGKLFGSWFAGDSWNAWRVFLKVLFEIPLFEQEQVIFNTHTKRETLPRFVKEAWVICGRRGGKSIIASLIAVYLAFFMDHKMRPGEKGTGMIIAPDRKQGRVIFNYIKAFIEYVPMLKAMVLSMTKESIVLSNGISIEIHTASYRSTRGYTVVFCIIDEIAFLRDESSATPDNEILTAIKPAMITVPDSKLICISSPYARRGELWRTYKDHFGQEHDRILVWQGTSEQMNPVLKDNSEIATAYESDPVSASAEYGATFRNDVESYVSVEVVESCVVWNRFEIAPLPEIRYTAFVDPSGGSKDSFTLAISHLNKERIAVLDCVRERKPPFSPENVVSEFADCLKSYRCNRVTGDRYGGEFPRELFRKRGIDYVISERVKSDIYLEFLPLLNSSKVELLENKRLISQLCSLERRTGRKGDSIDHLPNTSDDVANSCCAALLLANKTAMHLDDGVMERFKSSAVAGSRTFTPDRVALQRNRLTSLRPWDGWNAN